MKLLIICLRRSGSTIFWNTFNQDERLTCFDEPFNPMYAELPRTFHKPEANAVKKLWAEDPETFWKYYAPIPWWEELDPELTPTQEEYLRFLFEQGEHVVIDVTRCHFKVEHILDRFPDVKIVYLTREPQAFISSHLLPNRTELSGLNFMRSRLKYFRQKMKFFFAKQGFDTWDMERIIGRTNGKFDHTYLRGKTNIDHLSAVEKLMCYWRCVDVAIKEEMGNYPNQIMRLSFEDFCDQPEQVLKQVYTFCGLDSPVMDCSYIRSASRGYKPKSKEWESLLA